MKVHKTVHFGDIDLTAYFYVHNLFNRKNAQNVYARTGSTSSDGSFSFDNRMDLLEQGWPPDALQLYELINIGHRQHYALTQGGDFFGHPREIRFGVEVNFSLTKK